MYSTSKLRCFAVIGLICLVVSINIFPVQSEPAETVKNVERAYSNTTNSMNCIQCGAAPPCPECPSGKICSLELQTCQKCSLPKCTDARAAPSISQNLSKEDNTNGNAKLIPAVIGGVLGIAILSAAAFGYMRYKRRKNTKGYFSGNGDIIDTSESKVWNSVDSENVIPIAYIPPATPTTPRPEPAHPRTRMSHLSIGTTPLATPLASPLPRTYSDEQLISSVEDDDTFAEVGTVLQATKATPSTGTGVMVTATRAKPALVRLNTIKSNNHAIEMRAKKEYSPHIDPSIPSTPATPKTGNTLLSVHSSSNIPSTPSTPTTFHSISVEDEDSESMLLPRIDVERSSVESSRSGVKNNSNSIDSNKIDVSASSPSLLISPFLDPSEGRQSFGLFGSDEVDSSGASSTNLGRESVRSSSFSNPRSTLMSDEGDGEIMIFWGGDTPTFLSHDPSTRSSGSPPSLALSDKSNIVAHEIIITPQEAQDSGDLPNNQNGAKMST